MRSKQTEKLSFPLLGICVSLRTLPISMVRVANTLCRLGDENRIVMIRIRNELLWNESEAKG